MKSYFIRNINLLIDRFSANLNSSQVPAGDGSHKKRGFFTLAQ